MVDRQLQRNNPKTGETPWLSGGLYCNFGSFLSDIKDLDNSVECLSMAIDTLEQINLVSPTDLGSRFLANSYICRANTLGMMKQWEDAFADADNAILIATSPGQRDEMVLEKARLTANSGNHAAAVASVEDALTRIDSRPDAGYQYILAARVMALCAEGSQTTVNSNDAEPDFRGKFALRSVQLLESAKQSGYFGNRNRIDELYEEEDFDPIRNLTGFKTFCQQLSDSDGKNETRDAK